jgi:hypothetical protein
MPGIENLHTTQPKQNRGIAHASSPGGLSLPSVPVLQELKEPSANRQSKMNEMKVAYPDSSIGSVQRKRVPAEGVIKTKSDHYDTSLTSGRKLFVQGVKWFRGDHDAVAPVSNAATTDAVAAAGYKDFWFAKNSQEIVVCTHRGAKVAGLESGLSRGRYNVSEDLYDDQCFYYSNSFNIVTGEFHASNNYGKADNQENEATLGKAPNNSEIIWHQHLVAKAFAATLKLEGDAGIRSISRNQISNDQTLDTIFMCDKGAEAAAGQEITLTEPTEDAMALLGTPNGNSAVWLLMQHGHQSGATDIASVTYSKDRLVITYM